MPLIVFGLVGLWRGVAYGLRYRRPGGEVFAVRERGLIHRRGRGTGQPRDAGKAE